VQNVNNPTLRRSAVMATVLFLSIGLSGCIAGLPPAFQAASLVFDGVSYLSTGKSVSDHALSAVAQRDCAVFRALSAKPICVDDEFMDELEVLDRKLSEPNSTTITPSENLTTLTSLPRWQPYTPRQRRLAQANSIDQVIMMSQHDDVPR